MVAGGRGVLAWDLGQTEDKTKLIYGSPSEIRSTATHLRKLQGAFDKVGGGLKGVDASALKGQAADAFRSSVSVEPPKWFKAADAFEKAAAALDSFSGTVEWAQGQAQAAIDKWKAGTKASEDARDVQRKDDHIQQGRRRLQRQTRGPAGSLLAPAQAGRVQ